VLPGNSHPFENLPFGVGNPSGLFGLNGCSLDGRHFSARTTNLCLQQVNGGPLCEWFLRLQVRGPEIDSAQRGSGAIQHVPKGASCLGALHGPHQAGLLCLAEGIVDPLFMHEPPHFPSCVTHIHPHDKPPLLGVVSS